MARLIRGGKGGRRPDNPRTLAADETYWSEIARAFDVDRTLINLNNGGCSPAPAHVLEQMIRDLRFSNEMPVYQMWMVLEPRIESCRRELAAEFGCDPEEMAITRNASESLENLIFGIDLKPGDEVVYTTQNYPRMITSWEQRARRDGIVVKPITFPFLRRPPRTSSTRFRQAITPRTRVFEVTHITNLTGQILPGPRHRPPRPRARHRDVRGRRPRVRAVSRSSATTSSATTTPRACTSGCSRRSAPGSSTSARASRSRSGR